MTIKVINSLLCDQGSEASAAKVRNLSKSSLQPLQEALKPLVDEQKSINEKIAKLNHSIEVNLDTYKNYNVMPFSIVVS